jgi:hypothetical protein
MRIMKWAIIACLVIGLTAYGLTAFGGQDVSAEVSQEAKGSFVRLDDGGKKLIVAVEGKEATYPLSAKVWVYRDMQKSVLEQLQAGDALDMVLNSKEQAAYIKATSPQFAAAVPPAGAAAASTAAASSSSQPQPEAASPSLDSVVAAGASKQDQTVERAAGQSAAPLIANEKPNGAAVKPASDSGPAAAPTAAYLDKLSMEWKSRDLTMRINREGSDRADVYIQGKDRSVVHLSGSAAEALIQQLIKDLPADKKSFEEQLKQRISAHFQLQDVKPEWKLDAKWQQAALSSSPSRAKGLQQEKYEGNNDNNKDKDKNKDTDKNKDKGKDNGKSFNNGNENNRDHDK